MDSDRESSPPPDAESDDSTGRRNWRRIGLIFLSLLLVLEGAHSILMATRTSGAYDAMAYVGAGVLMHSGAPTMYTLGFVHWTPAGEPLYMAAFLYHPAVGAWYAALLDVVGVDSDGLGRITNLVGLATLFAGLALAMRAARWPPPVAACAFWLVCHSFALEFAILLGNLSTVVAGLGLLGCAALASRRWICAGALLALGALFKVYFWLPWVALLLFWRPHDGSKSKTWVLATWGLLYAAFSFIPLLNPENPEMEAYVSRLLTMGNSAWSISVHDGSVASLLLKWNSAATPEHYMMLTRSIGNVQAQIGEWRHDRIALARAAAPLAAAAYFVLLFALRRRIAGNPVGILAASFAAAALVQPANWVHNYPLLMAAPIAADLASGHRRAPAMWIALAAALVAMHCPASYLDRWGFLPPVDAAGNMEDVRGAWMLARLAGSLQTALLALLAVLPLIGQRGADAADATPRPASGPPA